MSRLSGRGWSAAGTRARLTTMANDTAKAAVRNFRLKSFRTSDAGWQQKFHAAVAGLRGNVREVPGASEPVLIEGGKYAGMWLESGPIDARAYAVIDPQPYLASHRVLFDLQREDGQIPCFVRKAGIGWSQVQTVTSLAVTALDCALQYGDDAFLARAYDACSRWDGWLAKYRDRQGLGLCEAFCEYDTGHDNSPRWHGLPKICVDRDAKLCPENEVLPYLAPDLSASLYGGRLALAEMAERLGRPGEAQAWRDKAKRTRDAMYEHLFDEQTLCFYDRNAKGEFVQIVGDVLLRVLAEDVVDEELFQRIFDRWVSNEKAFWTPLPMPSIAACDPAFPETMPDNSWGGASQALTALRAGPWFERYGKFAEHTDMMSRWVPALVRANGFMQQADPFTAEFATTEDYSPAMGVMVDYTLRLSGVRVHERSRLSWGCWSADDRQESSCAFSCEAGEGELVRKDGVSELRWGGEVVARVQGRARVITTGEGALRRIIGIGKEGERVTLEAGGEQAELVLEPNQVMCLKHGCGCARQLKVGG